MRKIRSRVRSNLGRLYTRRGEVEKGRENYMEALALARSIGDAALVAGTLIGVNLNAAKRGAYSEKLQAVREAAALFKEAKDNKMVIVSLTAVGSNLMTLGSYDEAAAALKEAEDLARAIGGIGRNREPLHFNLGRVAHLQGRVPEAVRRFEEQVAAAPDPDFLAYGLVYLSLAHLDNRQPDRAIETASRALAVSVPGSRSEGEGMARMALAKAYLKQGDLTKADEESRQAVEILNHKKGAIEEFDLEIRLIRAQVLVALDRRPEAWTEVNAAQQVLEGRASKISAGDEKYKASLLKDVAVNREIGRLWQVLKGSQSEGSMGLSRALLGRQQFHPTASPPPELSFIDRAQVGALDALDITGRTAAGTVFAKPLVDVWDLLTSGEVVIPVNDSEMLPEFRAEDIHWKPFFGADGNLYAIVDWKIASDHPIAQAVAFALTHRSARQMELLKADVSSQNGALSLRFRPFEGSSVPLPGGGAVEIPPRSGLRPPEGSFGRLTFTLSENLRHQTTLGLDMEKALHTEHPWNLVEALITGNGN